MITSIWVRSVRTAAASALVSSFVLLGLGVSAAHAAPQQAPAPEKHVIYRAAHVIPYARATEETRMVVFNHNGGWIVLHGTNGYTSEGISSDVTDQLDQLNSDGKTIQDVAFTSSDEWVILNQHNAAIWSSGVPTDVINKLKDLNNNSEDIKYIGFMDDDSWVILWGDNGWASEGLPDVLNTKLHAINDASEIIRDVAFVPGGTSDNPDTDWVVLSGTNAATWTDGIPSNAVDKIKELNNNGDDIKFIAFQSATSWVLLSAKNDATYTTDLPADLITELKTLAGDTSGGSSS